MGWTIKANNFLRDYGWVLAIIAAAIVLIVVFIIFIVMRVQKKKVPQRAVSVSAYMEALGGVDNIISHELRGSRIVIALHDFSLLDKEKLKEVGVDSFILMSDKLTLVIKGDAEHVYQLIFPQN